jgi:hypothetical protein
MAKQRIRPNTTLDDWAIAAGSTLGRLVAKIDRLTARRTEISAEIEHYVRQAEGALRKAAAGGRTAAPAPAMAKRAARKRPARKRAAAKAKRATKARKRA